MKENRLTYPFSDGEIYAYPENGLMVEKIPVLKIIEKLDLFLSKEEYNKATNLLKYWQKEAEVINDYSGEISIVNEILGLSRRVNDKEWGLFAVERCLYLIEKNSTLNDKSKGTFYLNLATTLKAFGEVESSVKYYKISEDILTKILDKNDSLLAGLYNNYALALGDILNYEKAIEILQKAIVIMSDKNPLDLAISHLNLAEIYYKISNENLAKENMEIAYENLAKKFDDLDDGYAAFVFKKCAPTFTYYGYTIVANQLISLAEKIYERNRNK